MNLFSRIRTLLIFIYRISKKIFIELFKWYDVWIFIIVLYGTMKINKRFFYEPIADQDLLQNFIEWYAIFYALTLTMIIGEGWNRLNKINFEIDREADALLLLLQTGKLFPNQALFDRLLAAVRDYVQCVSELQLKDDRSHTPSQQRLLTVRHCIDAMIQDNGVASRRGARKTNPQEFLKAELLRQYCEAYDARGDRFDLINQKIPKHVWLILGAFSLGWLWGFLWLAFNDKALEVYVLGSTTLSIACLFYVARALNDPTKGSWKLTFKPFKENLAAEPF
jgi:hypothetical protein